MKTMFLDFGNVIGRFDHYRAVNQLVKFTPLSAKEVFSILYDGPLEIAFEAGQISKEEYIERGCREAKLNCTPEQFLTCFVDIFWRNDPVCDLLPRLARRYRLVLASNTNDAHFTKYTEQFADDLKHFAYLGASHRAGWRKPHPHFFQYCQEHAEARPEECVFVDDLRVNIEAGTQHGWKGVLYTPGESLEQKLVSLGIPID